MKALRWPLWCLEAIPFFGIMGLFKLISVDAASAFGGWLARMLAPIAPAHTTARNNLEAAFPEKSPAEINAILTGMWDNLGRTFAEYAHFRKFDGYPNARIAVRGLEHAQTAVALGKGAIALSGHCANWELMALTAYQAGLDGAEVYRPVNNPLVNWWIMRQRRRYAYPLQVSKNGDARALLRTLKDGKVIAMLTDQKHSEGLPIPFFGRDAWTATGPAVLSLRTGSALIPVRMVRTKGARFEMTFYPPLEISRSGDKDADIRATLVTICSALEETVRAHPAQWLWAHNRWRIPAHAQPGIGPAAS
jgi:KDO2-lipid IV(A) lauroyltransferase